ncbi:MAG TPA: TIM barrel protein [Bacillota bacterium]
MDQLLFGISGLPVGDQSPKRNYRSGIAYLKTAGLDAMELPFVRNVNVTDKNKDEILQEKLDKDFFLSAHGSYFINLNADETEKQQQSMERIIKGAKALKSVGGNSLVFHPGFYLNDSPEVTYATIKENLMKLPDLGVAYRLETTGKPTQFGSLDELIGLCNEVPTCRLCVDFAHIHARGGGSLKTYDDYTAILAKIRERLGEAALFDMHIHLSGINYGAKGEKNHLSFAESDFNYTDCLKALKDYKVKGCVICESPILEKDAALLKETYNRL